MFERLEQRGERLARTRARGRRERVAMRVGEAVPGVSAQIEGEAVVLSGRRLGRRYDASPALRWRIAEACDER